ncbi:hypothetical protein JTE90_002655 [Oedothorax gibbosus]|uniref:Uncharacterized protein n=1 Tax=Oedothorax gibbosus TaxID=931172 RepID=A0AAV6UDE8_9ARAC|nr:hypothetical protein JTE90_002655 [Oedothorax gibbosus]
MGLEDGSIISGFGEKEPMLNHSRVGGGAEESPAPPPVRNRRQSAIDRAARLVDITHHTVVHVSADVAVAGDVVRSPEKSGNGSQGTAFVAKIENAESPGNQNSNA